MNTLPPLLNSKNSFITLADNLLSELGFTSSSSKIDTFVSKTNQGKHIIAFDFYSTHQDTQLRIKTSFGYSHTAIQRILAECYQEPFATDEEILTFTIGGSRHQFVNDSKFSIDITDTTKHKEVIDGICQDYLLYVQDYFERFSNVEGVLREFRNPDVLTRKLILSVITQSHIIMIAAHLTQNKSFFHTILEQEKKWFLENAPDAYPAYEKVSRFLLGKRSS